MARSPLYTSLVALALLVATNGPVFFIVAYVMDDPIGWDVPVVRWTFAVLALLGMAMVGFDGRERGALVGQRATSVAVFAIVGFSSVVVLSSLWSIDPAITRGRSWIYVGLAAWAWVISRLDRASLRRAILAMLGAGLGASALAVVVSNSIGSDLNGDWRGIYTNRNSLAPLSAMGVIVALGLLAERRRRPVLVGVVLLVGSSVMMLGAGSRTTWFALAAAAFTASVVCGARIGFDRLGRPALAAAGGAAVVGVSLATVAVWLMWAASTFAQRRDIWSFAWERIVERPLFGYGWFTVWVVPEFIGTDPLLARGNAHSSVFDVGLGIGLVGLIPFLAIVVLAVVGASRDAWREPSSLSWTWLALVILLLVENLTESFVLQYSYNWVLLMAAALRSGVAWRSPRAARTPQPSAAVTA